ncbi:MAG: TonB family protein [Deltaproteobacteria bacterium]|nr:TonB family protein [Deltaproteobacteria bacterium]
MSYKSLLFCPDEKTARTVTQVLSELDFAVETIGETDAAVRKLTQERYDALVVDCQNEADATLLFKSARDSEQNHSSLSVAVVEGQTGVAKAFRIGANLVLTKPINIEQSKGTLRVARGLLRKTEVKPAARVKQSSEDRPASVPRSATIVAKPAAPATAPSSPAISGLPQSPTPTPAPFARLEVDPEPAPSAGPAEVAVLESLPKFTTGSKPTSAAKPLALKPETTAVSSLGLGAAVSPALEKSSPFEVKAAGMLPALTHEPIIKEASPQPPSPHPPSPQAPPPPRAPEFAALTQQSQKNTSGAIKVLKVGVQMVVIAAAGYLAWEKLQPLEYLHHSRPAEATKPPAGPAAGAATGSTSNEPLVAPPQSGVAEEPARTPSAENSKVTISPTHATPSREAAPESIAVQELPMTSETKSSATAKPVPLVVKTGSPAPSSENSSLPAPPSPPAIEVSSVSTSKNPLENLVSASNAPVPRIAAHSVVVSQGVSQGLLLKKVPPVYPPMAVRLRKEGAVQLLATINKQGLISNVKVISGDSILAKSATDAVLQWKYRPYLLNGQPVEMETQITINFQTPH